MKHAVIAPELAAFIGRPPKLPINGKPVRGPASMHDPETTVAQETTMPTGVYPRKKKAVAEPASEARKKPKKARKTRAVSKCSRMPKGSKGPRFGVWEDGRVEISTDTCSGFLTPSAARELMEFMGRLGVK